MLWLDYVSKTVGIMTELTFKEVRSYKKFDLIKKSLYGNILKWHKHKLVGLFTMIIWKGISNFDLHYNIYVCCSVQLNVHNMFRRHEDFFWKSHVHSIYVVCPGNRNLLNGKAHLHGTANQSASEVKPRHFVSCWYFSTLVSRKKT